MYYTYKGGKYTILRPMKYRRKGLWRLLELFGIQKWKWRHTIHYVGQKINNVYERSEKEFFKLFKEVK